MKKFVIASGAKQSTCTKYFINRLLLFIRKLILFLLANFFFKTKTACTRVSSAAWYHRKNCFTQSAKIISGNPLSHFNQLFAKQRLLVYYSFYWFNFSWLYRTACRNSVRNIDYKALSLFVAEHDFGSFSYGWNQLSLFFFWRNIGVGKALIHRQIQYDFKILH